MNILGIETSCDETAAAVVEKTDNIIQVLSHTTATSVALHAKTAWLDVGDSLFGGRS